MCNENFQNLRSTKYLVTHLSGRIDNGDAKRFTGK